MCYFYIWNESDRLGFSRWVDYSIKNNLFLKNGKENKVSVWYEAKELKTMLDLVSSKLRTNPEMIDRLEKVAAKEWGHIEPIIKGKEAVKDARTLKKYYLSVVRWWSVMTIIYYVPNLKDVPENILARAEKLRSSSEEYSSAINSVFENYLKLAIAGYEKYFQVISPQEIFYLGDKQPRQPLINKLESRLGGFGMINGRVYPLVGLEKVLRTEGLELDSEVADAGDEIKGVSASSGTARGKVRIITSKKLLGELMKGEILVTEMTEPDYVVAIKKAGAIVTDEGGVTCHAAIVARELKKPCVIGTKIATKDMKDGDLVEVDADKGVVKILKRA